MPSVKSPREEPPNQVAPDPNAAKRVTIATDSTGFGYLGWFSTNSEGCTVRFGIEPQAYLLELTLPNYNALFSHLLACWLNRCNLSLTYQITTFPDPNVPLRIVSIVALSPSSPGE